MASGGSIRELNDFISKYTYIATRGVFAPSVFVSDISERVRAGEQEVENFFTFTDQLNHAGISYEIVPEEDSRGIHTLESLPELPEREFTFTGGDLLAMRRKTESGYFWLVCNLWEEKELSGTFCCENRSIELTIAPGEIAVIGDQVYTDILGANACGMLSIMVQYFEAEDKFFFRLKRKLEKPVLAHYRKIGQKGEKR